MCQRPAATQIRRLLRLAVAFAPACAGEPGSDDTADVAPSGCTHDNACPAAGTPCKAAHNKLAGCGG